MIGKLTFAAVLAFAPAAFAQDASHHPGEEAVEAYTPSDANADPDASHADADDDAVDEAQLKAQKARGLIGCQACIDFFDADLNTILVYQGAA